ncbi:DNA damage-inducible protein 1 [Zostera marina]|uniref:DNA damage-inducible protein 1 n=1 Tax=Zostera marina TaxID=29655 RepID=A0A0K9PYF7_ZOSMR|nr:DNA damage-inducible protein 1 [Zostera marina]
MKITVMASEEQFITVEVDPNESVENVKALLEVETGVAIQKQQLQFNGKEMGDSERLNGIGVGEGDLITMTQKASAGVPNRDLSLNSDGSAVNAIAFQEHIRQDSQSMAHLFQNDPSLAQAFLGNDINTLQNLLRERHQRTLELRRKENEQLALMYSDPFDIESQKKIEESIRQKGIDENWQAAIEHNPESFAGVVMLYVDMEVNGIPIKAFVDSGAQSTIISKRCAESCGLLRLLDQRYKGIAVGVGQSEILGRIHVAPIKIGSTFYPCSFAVLDTSNMDFLFGLDMLRKHQCIIDLKENVLRVGAGEVSVPFLQEKDIPSHNTLDGSLKKPSHGSASVPESSGGGEKRATTTTPGSGNSEENRLEESIFEAKIGKLVTLGFSRQDSIKALSLFNNNEEQAAGYLFGG